MTVTKKLGTVLSPTSMEHCILYSFCPLVALCMVPTVSTCGDGVEKENCFFHGVFLVNSKSSPSPGRLIVE